MERETTLHGTKQDSAVWPTFSDDLSTEMVRFTAMNLTMKGFNCAPYCREGSCIGMLPLSVSVGFNLKTYFAFAF